MLMGQEHLNTRRAEDIFVPTGPEEAQRLRARPFFLLVAHEPQPLRPTLRPVELALCPRISEGQLVRGHVFEALA
jgi:hypothetical protein